MNVSLGLCSYTALVQSALGGWICAAWIQASHIQLSKNYNAIKKKYNFISMVI